MNGCLIALLYLAFLACVIAAGAWLGNVLPGGVVGFLVLWWLLSR